MSLLQATIGSAINGQPMKLSDFLKQAKVFTLIVTEKGFRLEAEGVEPQEYEQWGHSTWPIQVKTAPPK